MKRAPLPLFVLLAVTAPALAHSPAVLDPDEPYEVEDATISRALYGTFESGEEVFIIRLRFDRDFALPFELFVPHRAALKNHRPAYAIVGAGLPPPSAEDGGLLPRTLPEGAGAFVDLNRVDPRPVFYESFTRRFFWGSETVALVLPQGAYEVWIWSPERTTGKFGVGFGVEERVDFGEAIRNWSDYAY